MYYGDMEATRTTFQAGNVFEKLLKNVSVLKILRRMFVKFNMLSYYERWNYLEEETMYVEKG